MSDVPVTIIGGGVIGSAIAYELSKSIDGIFLIEKNKKITGENQSSRNSGVIHAGIYYPKDEELLKSVLCVEGNKLMYEFCEEHDVPYRKTGKIVVAVNNSDEVYLDSVLETALMNDVPGVKKITEQEVRVLEPNVNAISAVYVPTSGIVEPTQLVSKLEMLSRSQRVHFVTGNEVIDIQPRGKTFRVITKTGNKTDSFDTKLLINAAGLYSDEIARIINPDSPYEIEPVRGESAKFYKTKSHEINMNGLNVYPAPQGFYKDTGEKAELPFKLFLKLFREGLVGRTVGVHLTPTFDMIGEDYIIGNTVTIGPLYTAGVGKKDYSSNLHPEEDYLTRINGFFNNLSPSDIMLHQAGIQAKLKNHRDFVIEQDIKYLNCINLIGIDSPGLTSSLAIAKYVKEIVKQV
ncbi:NAD(P)/FAD-dependent oxidoreductase [candidate division KSB1 bacterium]